MKNKDKLEKFIHENREDFDVFEPDEQLWDGIGPATLKTRRNNLNFFMLRVAAVIAIFAAAYFYYDWMNSAGHDQTAVNNDMAEKNMEQIQVLVDAEGYYSGKINSAKQEITQMAGKDRQVMDMMNSDLDELTGIFESLKNDLKDNSDNQEVIEAMIQNYRIRLQILDEMLNQLKDSKKSKEKQDQHEI